MSKTKREASYKAVCDIPASGGGAIGLYPATLRQKLSSNLIRLIVDTVLEVVTDPDKPDVTVTK